VQQRVEPLSCSCDGAFRSPAEMMSTATWRRKHFNLLTGCIPVLSETLRGFQMIGRGDKTHLFVAGDRQQCASSLAVCAPSGFDFCRTLDDGFRCVLLKYEPQMWEAVATDGWPEHVPEKTQREQKHEKRARDEGFCPSNPRCTPAWFCGHSHRCFVCDAHSCDECRIVRGDGEVVASLAKRLNPHRLAVDFDRTLANTRKGNAPIIGKHTVDMELLSLFWLYPDACMVVTRNCHVAEIRAFLAAHGAPEAVPVHSLRRPASKASCITSGLDDDHKVLFIDDRIEELVDPLISNDSRVHRVLFVR